VCASPISSIEFEPFMPLLVVPPAPVAAACMLVLLMPPEDSEAAALAGRYDGMTGLPGTLFVKDEDELSEFVGGAGACAISGAEPGGSEAEEEVCVWSGYDCCCCCCCMPPPFAFAAS
jgi:hypothetical protein